MMFNMHKSKFYMFWALHLSCNVKIWFGMRRAAWNKSMCVCVCVGWISIYSSAHSFTICFIWRVHCKSCSQFKKVHGSQQKSRASSRGAAVHNFTKIYCKFDDLLVFFKKVKTHTVLKFLQALNVALQTKFNKYISVVDQHESKWTNLLLINLTVRYFSPFFVHIVSTLSNRV